MAKLERMRDFMTAPPPAEYFSAKAEEGWRLVAVEWERGAAANQPSRWRMFPSECASRATAGAWRRIPASWKSWF